MPPSCPAPGGAVGQGAGEDRGTAAEPSAPRIRGSSCRCPYRTGPPAEGAPMRTTTSILSTVLAVGAVVLAGCGSDDDAGSAGSASSGTESSASSGPSGQAVLATTDSDLGEIVVDGKGMTVYLF